MNRARAAERLLREAAEGMRTLAKDALSQGDFASLQRIAELAKALDQVCADLSVSLPAVEAEPKPSTPSRSPHRAAPSAPSANGATPARGKPLFFRQGDDLVKIGKSKGRGASYEHHASAGVLKALTTRIATGKSRETLIRMEDVLPLKDPASGSQVPDYQAYLCLAWLREEGLVQQHGRRGYTVPEPSTVVAQAESRFAKLSRR